MKKHCIQSNFSGLRDCQVHKKDSYFDFDWDYRKPLRMPKLPKYKPLPSPKEVRLAMQARIVEAELARPAWVEQNRLRLIAEARQKLGRP